MGESDTRPEYLVQDWDVQRMPTEDREKFTKLLDKVKFHVENVETFRIEKGENVLPHTETHNTLYIGQQHKAELSFGSEQERHVLSKRALLLVPARKVHSLKPRGQLLDLIKISFTAPVWGSVDLFENISVIPPVFYPHRHSKLLTGARRCLAEHEQGLPGWHQALDGELTSMLFHLFRYYHYHFAVQQDRNLHQGMQKLFPILGFLEENLTDPKLKIRDIALKHHVSQPYLRKLFLEVLNLHPNQYIQKNRIELAKAFLEKSDKDYKEICYLTGHSSLPYFYHNFKRWTGTTPKDYRNHLDGSAQT